MKKVYPSSSAFAVGNAVYTRYNSGCLRKILLNAHGIRETLKHDTREVGAANEENYESALKAGTVAYEREKVLVSAIDDSGDVVFSGRVDFVLHHVTGIEVVELKSTQSDNKLRELKKGQFTPENLAQLIAYMCELESVTGRLIYTYYNKEKNLKLNYEFAVTILDDGGIQVNGNLYRFTVHDYYRHRYLAADVVSNDVIYPRPVGAEDRFAGCCAYCPFKARCDLVDMGALGKTETFWSDLKFIEE